MHPPLEAALRAVNAHWATSVVAAAVTHKLFDALEPGPLSLEELAARCAISERGARAVLDGLLAEGLVQVTDGRFHNSPAASCYFVSGKPLYLGDLALVSMRLMLRAAEFPEAVATGRASVSLKTTADLPEWAFLVRATAPFTVPVAERAAELFEIATRGPLELLDPGGGAGVFSAVFLAANPAAHATQLDWPSVNAVARDWVARFGVESRFQTVDGNLFAFDYPTARYDFVVFSQMAHGFSVEENARAFQLFRQALKPSGLLLINDLLPELDGSATQQALLSSARSFFATEHGVGYRLSEYRDMLQSAGFETISRHDTGTPTTLIAARP